VIRFRIVFQLLEPGLKKGNEDLNAEKTMDGEVDS